MKHRNYKQVYAPFHPFKRSNGTVYEHRLVAEGKIGRYLTPTESVHHINRDIRDNRPENLMIFATVEDHLAYHHGLKAVEVSNHIFVVPDKRILSTKCPECGGIKNKQSLRCISCEYTRRVKVNYRNSNRPPKDVLLKELSNSSFLSVAKKYGVSDNAVRKWVRTYGEDPKMYGSRANKR